MARRSLGRNGPSGRVYVRDRRTVKWNSPFYGDGEAGWFLNFSCLTKYIKVAFFQGTLLDPVPPVESKIDEVRYFHIFEDDAFDERQFATWDGRPASSRVTRSDCASSSDGVSGARQPRLGLALPTDSLTGRVDVPDQPRDAGHPAARQWPMASILRCVR